MPKKARWDDEMLRRAVAASSTYKATLVALGLSGQGANYWTIKARIESLGIDVSHFHKPSIRWERLPEVVADATSFIDVTRKLGLPSTSGSWGQVRRRVRELDLDTTHFVRTRPDRRRLRKWTDEQLVQAVNAARSIAGLLRKLGLVPAGGNYELIRGHIARLGLDTSRITGDGWRAERPDPPIRKAPLSEYLIAGRLATSSHLKARLLKEGVLQPRCGRCGWAERAPDGRLPLELDHVNGDKTDNRLENLRILCPNCHSLQPTHRGLNRRSARAKRGS